jgi:hypothetical protein
MLMLRYSDGAGQLYRRSCTDYPVLMFRCLTTLRSFFDDAVQVSLRFYTGTLALQSRYTGAFHRCAFLVVSF